MVPLRFSEVDLKVIKQDLICQKLERLCKSDLHIALSNSE